MINCIQYVANLEKNDLDHAILPAFGFESKKKKNDLKILVVFFILGCLKYYACMTTL